MAIASREQLAGSFAKAAHCATCGGANALVYDPTTTSRSRETGAPTAHFFAECPTLEHDFTYLGVSTYTDADTALEVADEEEPTGLRRVLKRFLDGPTGMSPFAD